jgi:GNAT superfamily N-acetyltransferase
MRWLEVAPRYRIRRTDDIDEIRDLALQCFSERELERDEDMEQTTWWLVVDAEGDPAGFIGARQYPSNPTHSGVDGPYAYLTLMGVLPHARGSRLTERLARVLLRWARREGCMAVVTYAAISNAPSLRNLVRAGFLPYWPEILWVGDQSWVYLRADLAPPVEPAGAVH